MRVHLIAPDHGHMDLTSAPDGPPGRVAVVTAAAMTGQVLCTDGGLIMR